jgi:Resolvase, N terminal domain
MARADPVRAGLTVRCAIYTRKSSDEGLEQEFNSLDAQREACEAYIVSQRHAGWVALADMYDDGGLSGGTMERPALKRLLEDIKAGKVQIVVVYKVDRLTRSLADFAKIVDIFDAHNASVGDAAVQHDRACPCRRVRMERPALSVTHNCRREITGAHWSGPRFFGLRKGAGRSAGGAEGEHAGA